jgi:hypothetical protein
MVQPDPPLEDKPENDPAQRSFLSKLGGRAGDLIIEFVGTFVAIGGIALLICW